MRERQRARRPPAPPVRQREALVPAGSGTAPSLLAKGPGLQTAEPLVSPLPAAPAEAQPEVPVAEEVALEAPAAAPPEVELLIPPPPPDLEQQTQARASRATGAMATTGSRQQNLPPPAESVAGARANVQEPEQETTARAQGNLTAALREQPAPSPEIEQLCDDIQDAIENKRPPDEASLRRADPEAAAQEVGDALNDDISGQSQSAADEYDAVNTEATGSPEQVSEPLPDTPPVGDLPNVAAANVTPPPATESDVSLEADRAATADRIAEADIDNEVTRNIPGPPFSDAREGMAELEQVAAENPAQVLLEQEEAVAASRQGMRDVESRALAALEASRDRTTLGSLQQQVAMAGSEEEQRIAAAAAAETIFSTARQAVNDQLEPMVTTAMSMWNTGKERIATAFDTELQRAKDMVDERHEGVGGAIVSIWDDVTGLPYEITRIYTSAERTFGRDICALIREISTYVNGIVIACEEIIDNADRDIAELFSNLPAGLQDWASQQQAGFEERLTGLRDDVHTAQQDFTDDLVNQAGAAVQEARERIDALREAAKGLIQKVADAIGAFIEDPVRAIINGLLTVVGIAPAAFWALIAQIEQVAADIADDPLRFANNLMDAVRLGFSNFFDNFFDHLLTGFINWLFSAMGTVGVELPPDTSLKSIITFFLQLMGLTWPNIREILVRHIGEQNVELIEKAYELLTLLIEEGPGGIFEMIKERLDPAAMMQTVIEAAVSYMVETIVSVATVRILGLFNPAGAVLQAIEAIYKVLKWIFENAARIFSLVQTIVGGIADLIAGNIAGMAAKTEQALVGMLVPAIDFIAGFLGLGNLPEKIAEVVGGFQQMVLGAVDRAIGFLVERARGLLAGLGIGGGEEDGDGGALDDEVGEEFRFSADNEGHRLWIDTTAGVDVMVASRATKLELKIREWNSTVGQRPEENQPRIRELLPLAANQLGITLESATEAKEDITDALTVEAGEDERADIQEAVQQNAEATADEGALVPILTELFDLFGEESILTKYEPEFTSVDTAAQDTVSTQAVEEESTYSAMAAWNNVRDALRERGIVQPLHRQPLGTGSGDARFQTRNFDQVFLPGLNAALSAFVSNNPGVAEERLLGVGVGRPQFAAARRRIVHFNEAPSGEDGAIARAVSLKEEFQNLLFQGGGITGAVAKAGEYFTETFTFRNTHTQYRVDPPPNPQLVNSHLVVNYQYSSFEDPNPKTFRVDISLVQGAFGEQFRHEVVGDYLVPKPRNTYGGVNVDTEFGGQVETAFLEARDNLPPLAPGPQRIRLERAHLIADWFQGSGYRNALNIIQTSRDFNQRNMNAIEDRLYQELTTQQGLYPNDVVNMRLKVVATYAVYDNDRLLNVVRNILEQSQDLAADRDALARQMVAEMSGSQSPRVTEDITYEAQIFVNDQSLFPLPIMRTGSDDFRTEEL
ncbi:hypothetical protein CLV84_0873 [Neolewinella xylanilytica]|uniref:Uncharacterized protein n=1 Tax=Neolewinella xylanilytica TaxID=1514080 RepID=A0A2S6I8T9_9BACT|nr:hypothetical protein [Neolewinella xylanilytica]PPK87914.1 hypothetical protein CLV84_0873 [Neolewinella xylanilytica]